MLISDKSFKSNVFLEIKRSFIMIEVSIHQEVTTVLNFYITSTMAFIIWTLTGIRRNRQV